MQTNQCLDVANEIFQAIFMRDNPFTLEELKLKFASDIRLPIKVQDSTSGEDTFTILIENDNYITTRNSEKHGDIDGWMRERCDFGDDIERLAQIWQEINSIATERVFDSENVAACDPLYQSTNVFCSTNCGRSNNLIYCDGSFNSNYCLACERSDNLNYCLRVEDSNSCTNSYEIVCSGKISNSLFIQDCGSLHECIWCSHISNHEFCICNMQFEPEEYYQLKSKIVERIFNCF